MVSVCSSSGAVAVLVVVVVVVVRREAPDQARFGREREGKARLGWCMAVMEMEG